MKAKSEPPKKVDNKKKKEKDPNEIDIENLVSPSFPLLISQE